MTLPAVGALRVRCSDLGHRAGPAMTSDAVLAQLQCVGNRRWPRGQRFPIDRRPGHAGPVASFEKRFLRLRNMALAAIGEVRMRSHRRICLEWRNIAAVAMTSETGFAAEAAILEQRVRNNGRRSGIGAARVELLECS